MVIVSSPKKRDKFRIGESWKNTWFESFWFILCIYWFFGQPGWLNQESAKGRPPAMFASDRHCHLRIGPQQRQKLGPEGRPPKCLGINRKNHWWLLDVSSSVYCWIVARPSSIFGWIFIPIFGEDWLCLTTHIFQRGFKPPTSIVFGCGTKVNERWMKMMKDSIAVPT